ncbi:hypothetical protein I8748_28375 [Nostoc sp. CENA67]|uniref:Glycosyl transferase family 2 n=1 Tax=Amazonocrinis nigriterrae CENA67 TaxID=2794033 RepID=A0A8J7HUW7_9NOST|nr:hypothetical protein [Amazonocrinis nigriterrae]MBH8566032.1 hypothetical protein [Amazonocrinis nigriterrae CENA67]
MPSDQLIVVIRTIQERTFDACKALVVKQIPEQLVYVVSEQPFEAALRCCYQIGIDSGVKWMMTLDADVLLREGAVEAFLSEAERLPPYYLQMEGLVFDKFMGIYRKAGHRMYRTQYLSKALQCIPPERVEIRPEYATLQKMEALGFPSMEIQTVFGIHDYEQYYVDIYRKAFVHANKHSEWITHLIERWKAQASHDFDYLIALRGLYDGLMSLTQACIDRRDYIEGAHRALEELGIREKTAPTVEQIDFLLVKSILNQVGPIPLDTSKITPVQRLKNQYQRLGLFRLIPYLFGAILSRAGEQLKTSVT